MLIGFSHIFPSLRMIHLLMLQCSPTAYSHGKTTTQTYPYQLVSDAESVERFTQKQRILYKSDKRCSVGTMSDTRISVYCQAVGQGRRVQGKLWVGRWIGHALLSWMETTLFGNRGGPSGYREGEQHISSKLGFVSMVAGTRRRNVIRFVVVKYLSVSAQ